MSGRARTERYFWWIRISDRTEETAFSETYRKYVGEPPSPVWRRVNTFSPGARHSPNYVYHSAFGASRIILQAFQRAQFSDEARRKLLTTFLGLLQSDGNDNRADAYAHEIVQLVMTPGRNSGAMIEAKDLPILRPNETSDSLTRPTGIKPRTKTVTTASPTAHTSVGICTTLDLSLCLCVSVVEY